MFFGVIGSFYNCGKPCKIPPLYYYWIPKEQVYFTNNKFRYLSAITTIAYLWLHFIFESLINITKMVAPLGFDAVKYER